ARSEVLNVLKFGRFSFQVFSHKIMRWATPWFLAGALCLNASLAFGKPFYAVSLGGQVCLYLSPVFCNLLPALKKLGVMRIASYFVITNVAIVHATILA